MLKIAKKLEKIQQLLLTSYCSNDAINQQEIEGALK